MLIITLQQTCSACPSQWEGKLVSQDVIYIRYRHGVLSIGTGDTLNNAVSNSLPVKTLSENYSDGVLSNEDMIQALNREGFMFDPDLEKTLQEKDEIQWGIVDEFKKYS